MISLNLAKIYISIAIVARITERIAFFFIVLLTDELIVSVSTIEPVSYTHLDVYKRQGNYDYYLEKKDILGAKPITNNTSKSSSSAISKLNWQEEKVKQAQQKKIKNEIKRTEERMALIEAEIEELDNMYADPAISSDTAVSYTHLCS